MLGTCSNEYRKGGIRNKPPWLCWEDQTARVNFDNGVNGNATEFSTQNLRRGDCNNFCAYDWQIFVSWPIVSVPIKANTSVENVYNRNFSVIRKTKRTVCHLL